MNTRSGKGPDKAKKEAESVAEATRAGLHVGNTRQLVQALRTATARAVAASDTAPGPGGAAAGPFRGAVERALELAEYEAERARFLADTNKAAAKVDARGAVCRSYLAARGAMVADSIAEEAADVFSGLSDKVQAAAVESVDAAERAHAAAVAVYGPDPTGGALRVARIGAEAAEAAELAAGVASGLLTDAHAQVRAMLDAHSARALQHAVDGAEDVRAQAEGALDAALTAVDRPTADGYTTRIALAARGAATVADSLVADLEILEENAKSATEEPPRGTE